MISSVLSVRGFNIYRNLTDQISNKSIIHSFYRLTSHGTDSYLKSHVSEKFISQLRQAELLDKFVPFDPSKHTWLGMHGTSLKDAQSILKDGFKVPSFGGSNVKSFGMYVPGVYVTQSVDAAHLFGLAHLDFKSVRAGRRRSNDDVAVLYLIAIKKDVSWRRNELFDTVFLDRIDAIDVRVTAIRSIDDANCIRRGACDFSTGRWNEFDRMYSEKEQKQKKIIRWLFASVVLVSTFGALGHLLLTEKAHR